MIILASNSPRRKELMGLICSDFKCISSDVEEKADKRMSPGDYVCSLAKQKAEAVSRDNFGIITIGADTVVSLEGEILEKPKDEEDAFHILRSLSGKRHEVYTGVCITDGEKSREFYVKTDVFFTQMSDKEIKDYIATGEPMDKAGAYGIQGKASLFIEKIHGDYFNVVGFPVSKVNEVLKNF